MKKLALIGEKLGHSYSKIIHERYFELSGKKGYTYDLIEIPKDNLSDELARISKEYDGINVTIPYKLDVMKYLSSISPEAQKIGAVNTVKFTSEGAFGYNSDYYGLKYAVEINAIEVKDKDVVILGTGGASKAALAVSDDLGASSITFVTIEPEPVPGYRTIGYDDKIEGDVLINCTPVGMYPKTGVSPLKEFNPKFKAVVDMIYNPSVTELMKQGMSNGAKTVNGLYMLVAQAVKSEAIWNDEPFNRDITDRIYGELKASFEKRD